MYMCCVMAAGQGLGRNRQGINKPIEAKLRPQRMGMGFNDYEEHKLLKPEDQVKEEKPAEQVSILPFACICGLLPGFGRGASRVYRRIMVSL